MSNTGKENIGNSAGYQYISSIITVLSGLIFYLYIVRILSTTLVGSIALLLSISSLFTLIFSLDLGGVSRHFFSYHIGKDASMAPWKLFRSFLVAGIILAFAVFISTLFLSGLLASTFFHSLFYEYPIRLMSISIALSVLDSIATGILLGIQKFKANAIVTSAQSAMNYSIPVVFYLLHPTLESFVFGWIVSGFVILTLALTSIFHGDLFSRDLESSSRSAVSRYLLPVYLASLLGLSSLYIDRLVVAYFMQLSNIAIYNFAVLFYSSLGFIVVPVNHVLMSKVSERYAQQDQKGIKYMSRISATLLSMMYIPTALGLAAISPEFLAILGGSSYIAGAIPLTIMLFAGSLSVPTNVLLQTLAGTRNTKALFIASASGLVSNLALSIILIPTYGLIGAAFAYSSVGLVVLAVFVINAVKAGIFSFNFKAQFKILISSYFMYGLIIITEHYFQFGMLSIILYIAEGIFIYLVLIKILKPAGKEELRSITSSMSGMFSYISKLTELIF